MKQTDFNGALLRSAAERLGSEPKVRFKTYGCQQNVSDSERMAGMFAEAGFAVSLCDEDADVIVFNTCAVREHAEDKVFGHIGALKKLKESNPGLIIAVGGCMVQQQHIAQKLRQSYPFVDIIFNTNSISKLPAMVAERLCGGPSSCDISSDYSIEEGIPVKRERSFRAFLPIMYGCNNFCSYCVVPYVRGRERSRTAEAIECEFRGAVEAGYKDIMLLGQNVNSYGAGSSDSIDFPDLLRRLDRVNGDFKIRFMTSHPKDAGEKLFEAMRDCEKVSKVIHLPVQSGSDEILRMMNRRYTSADYLRLVDLARSRVPGISFTSDIIVGFPGETDKDFKDTVELVKRVGFYSLFTFIYSKREGTAAAEMPDDMTRAEKAGRLIELNAVQDAISASYDEGFIGRRYRCLLCQKGDDGLIEARMDNNAVVLVSGSGEEAENTYRTVEITDVERRRLIGRIVN